MFSQRLLNEQPPGKLGRFSTRALIDNSLLNKMESVAIEIVNNHSHKVLLGLNPMLTQQQQQQLYWSQQRWRTTQQHERGRQCGRERKGGKGGMRIFFLHRGNWKLLQSHVNHNIPKASNANWPSNIHQPNSVRLTDWQRTPCKTKNPNCLKNISVRIELFGQ